MLYPSATIVLIHFCRQKNDDSQLASEFSFATLTFVSAGDLEEPTEGTKVHRLDDIRSLSA